MVSFASLLLGTYNIGGMNMFFLFLNWIDFDVVLCSYFYITNTCSYHNVSMFNHVTNTNLHELLQV